MVDIYVEITIHWTGLYKIIKQNFNSEIIKTGSRDPGNFVEFDDFSDNV